MKILLRTIVTLSLTALALAIQDFNTEVIPLPKASISILERWTRLLAKKLEELGEDSEIVEKEAGMSISRPFVSFHPTSIENKGKELKQDWQDFEFKGFGPSVRRRFGFMDLRIIGKK